MSAAVAVTDVVKRFGDVVALDGVSFEVEEGALFGFIGPDGAGKTTLFRILVTLLVPDAGQARVLGRDVVPEMWSSDAASATCRDASRSIPTSASRRTCASSPPCSARR